MKQSAFIILLVIGSLFSCRAQETQDTLPETNQTSLKQWQDLRFGMFIHWGPVSLRGTEIGWSRGVQVPIEDYDALYKEFDPVLFNAHDWVKTAKDAGMKYIVMVTKHHDGFCLWPSEYTDYDIASTPYEKDILRQLTDECQKQGILFGTYYSVLDWHHADYTTRHGNDPRSVEDSDMNKYTEYMYHQLAELVHNYHTKILWFDGEWEKSWTHEEGVKLYKYCRDLDNELLINNRVDKGRKGMLGMSKSGFAGDFGTPEQEIGGFTSMPWESCITICKQWAWKPNDQMKSLKELIHTLARSAGGNGNLLLNVGPMLDGRIEQRQISRLKEMGDWLSIYGESIYNTNGGPYVPTEKMASTHRGSTVYLHLLEWPEKPIVLQGIKGYKVKNVRIMNGAKLNFKKDKDHIIIELPQNPPDLNDTVLELKLNKELTSFELIN
jgi:alpha-L-fucosidase